MTRQLLAVLLVVGMGLIVSGVWIVGGVGFALIVSGVGLVAVAIRREYD